MLDRTLKEMYYIRIYYGIGRWQYIINLRRDDIRDANLIFDEFFHFMEVDPIGLISEVRLIHDEHEVRREIRRYDEPKRC